LELTESLCETSFESFKGGRGKGKKASLFGPIFRTSPMVPESNGIGGSELINKKLPTSRFVKGSPKGAGNE